MVFTLKPNLGAKAAPPASGGGGWQRPSDWLPLPAPGPDTFIGLLAVTNDDSNYIALQFAGNYTVDWGDGGSPENVASGVQANHSYTFASIPDSTLTTQAYKQVMVVVTPQAGQQLTSVSIDVVNPTLYVNGNVPLAPWLDILVHTPNCTAIDFSDNPNILPTWCQRVQVTAFAGTSLSNLCATGFTSLQSFSLSGATSVTNFSKMLQYCSALQSIPLFDTSSGTNFSEMFGDCYSLVLLPLFDTSAGTNFSGMFDRCYSLELVPLLDISAGTDFDNMFNSCWSLRDLPALDVGAATSFSNTFAACYGLASAPLSSTPVSIDFSSAPCLLSEAAIVAIFEGLAVAVGQTITVTGNWGSANLTAGDLLIATAKGWTVVQ